MNVNGVTPGVTQQKQQSQSDSETCLLLRLILEQLKILNAKMIEIEDAVNADDDDSFVNSVENGR